MMTEIFNAATALEQAAGNEELARDLFSMLLDELPTQRESIASAFTRINAENAAIDILWDPVHKLHGSTAYLGVPALKLAVKAFEDKIKEGDRSQLEDNFKNLDTEIQRLLERGPNILSDSW